MDEQENYVEIVNEINNLPKDNISIHSSSSGPMSRFQQDISKRYMEQIGILEKSSQAIAKKTMELLQIEMNELNKRKKDIESKQHDLLNSMITVHTSFDDLQNRFKVLSQEYNNAVQNFKEKCLSIYSSKFQELSFTVTAVSKTTTDIEKQLPIHLQGKLQADVIRLNQLFLKNKEGFFEIFSQKEQDVKENEKEIMSEFESRIESWKKSHFEHLVNDTKSKLEYNYPIDYGDIFQDFHNEQLKFKVCFIQLLKNLGSFTSLKDFTQANLDNWWKDVENMLSTHSNFIQVFTQKIQKKIDERNTENEIILSKVEAELVELKADADSSASIQEMETLEKQSAKYHIHFLDKISKYWENRSQALRKTYEMIRSVLAPLIQQIQQYNDNIDKNTQKIKEDSEKLLNESSKKLSMLEASLQEKSDEIRILLDENSIDSRVEECKNILSQIENEYRSYYNESNYILDPSRQYIESISIQLETDILNSLKLQKISIGTDWSNNCLSSKESRKNSSRAIKKLPRLNRNRQNKKPKQLEIPIETFSITLPNGTKFEEREPFVIIQPIDDYVDESLLAQTTGRKGLKKPPTPRNKKLIKPIRGKGKGKGDDVDDIEIPEINIMELVPKIDDELSIHIYIPTNEDLESYPHDFETSLITSLEDKFQQLLEESKYTEERQHLSEELRERLRTFAPRGNLIEMNVAQARKIQLKQGQLQIENHFKQATSIFNKSLKVIEASIEKGKNEILSKVNELRSYIDKLSTQKSDEDLTILKNQFKFSNNQFNIYLAQALNDMNKEIQEFEDNFNSLNDRFLQFLKEDEKDLSSQYFTKMNDQVSQILNEIKGKPCNIKTEATRIQVSINDEFETLFPYNVTDVIFVQKLQEIQSEIKSKFDSILFNCKQSEKMIERKIQDLKTVRNLDLDAQSYIQKQFSVLDSLRITLLNRAHYIGILKSKISNDHYNFSIDLMSEISEQTEKPPATNEKKKGRTSRASKTHSETSSKKVSKKVSSSINDIPDSILAQVNNLEDELNSRVNVVANDYYNQFKQRKVPITRPMLISPSLNECLEKIKVGWKEINQSLNPLIDEASDNFRIQLVEAIKGSQETMTRCINVASDFYIDMIKTQKDAIDSHFNSDLSINLSERDKHKKQLGAGLSDRNKQELLELLNASELQRVNEEVTLIQTYRCNIVTTEKNVMKLFTTNVSNLIKYILGFFDVFPFSEDLEVGSTIKAIERSTITSLLKEKIRIEANAQLDTNRPFRIRHWPQLNTTFSSIQNYVLNDSTITPSTSPSSARKRKRKSEKLNSEKIPSEPPQEKTPLVSSLETPIHRKIIINRNQSFVDYEIRLEDRLNNLNSYINSFEQEISEFSQYWKNCIESFTLPKLPPLNSNLNQVEKQSKK